MKTEERKTFYIPEALNLAELLREHGLERQKDTEFFAKCCYLIDSLYVRRVMRGAAWTEYFPINLEILRSVLGWRGGPAAKRALIKMGIIEAEMKNGVETYQSGVRSKAYRFCAQYHHARFRAVEVPSKKLCERLRVVHTQLSEKATKAHLGKSLIWESVKKLEFDVDGARAFAQGRKFETDDERNWWMGCLEWMESRDWRFSADAQGRVYHPLTNLPRELRPFVTYQGRRLYCVDVSASHPCLLSTLYKTDCEEKARYVRLVRTGEFYGHLNAKVPHPCDMSDDGQRNALKEEIFHCVFYGSAYAKPSPIGNAFAAEFPILAGLVGHEKRRHQRDLAKPLQRMESQIVIDKVATRFAEKHPSECLVSVHDSFFTMIEYTEELEKLFQEEYERVIGFCPRVKTTEVPRPRRSIPMEPVDWARLHRKIEEDNERRGLIGGIQIFPPERRGKSPWAERPRGRGVVEVR